MNLDNIDITVNHQTPAQALNLGLITARRYYPTLFIAGLAAITPFFCLAVLLVLLFDANIAASLLIWWAKPYYDRVILSPGSRLLFRENVSFGDIIRSLKTALSPGLFANLTWQRFSLIRGLTLPVSLLEKQTGQAYRQRVKIIGRKGKAGMSSATVVLLHFDLLLYINFFLLLMMLLPDSQRSAIWELFSNKNSADMARWFVIMTLFFQSVACLIIEVFYVMIGFMLYLNSRIISEGWGIELGFKRTAERLAGLSKKILLLFHGVGLALLLGLTAVPSSAVSADEAQIVIHPEKDKAQLKTILQNPNINPYTKVTRWEEKQPKKPEKKEKKDWENREMHLDAIAVIMKLLIIVAVTTVVLWGLYRYRAFWQLIGGKKKTEADAPQILFGLAVTPDSLPKNIAQAAQVLWQQQDFSGVLSLLYRSCLSGLINDYQADIKESHTEGDCLHIGQLHLSAEKYHYFSQLTALWQNVVYAHQPPEAGRVKTMINRWQSVFAEHSNTEASNEA
ncbi:MAG: hypothetical protein CR975_04445 [Gammaproteobacteria bacterium]|nr:MAG: hypothetical protein CR975_04445 [Gammaproteobacteria bacterium]